MTLPKGYGKGGGGDYRNNRSKGGKGKVAAIVIVILIIIILAAIAYSNMIKASQTSISTTGSTDLSSEYTGSSSISSGSRCPDGYHRSPSGDCEIVTDTRGMPRCPNGYHRSPDGDCEYVG